MQPGIKMKREHVALAKGAGASGKTVRSVYDELESAWFMQLLDASDCAELSRHGWTVEAFPDRCEIRKSTRGYGAKVHVVTLRQVGPSSIEAQGELFLHSMSCARTSPIHVERSDLGEWLWPLLDATESLNVFSDGGIDE
jgi:hypothetical protein